MSALYQLCTLNPETSIIYFDVLLPVTGSIFCMIIIPGMYQFCRAYYNRNLQSSKTQFWFTLVLFIFCFLQISVIIVRSISICRNIELSVALAATSGSLWTIQLWLLMQVLFLRLYNIFISTSFAVSSKIIKAWIILNILAILLCMFGGTLIRRNNLYNIAIITMIFGVFLFILMNIYIVVAFIMKLIQIHKTVEKSVNQENNAKLLDIATKCTLLCIISIFTAIIHLIVIGIAEQIGFHAWIWYFITRCIDVFSNFIAIFLSFNYFKNYYFKYCKCCHSICLLCLSKIWPVVANTAKDEKMVIDMVAAGNVEKTKTYTNVTNTSPRSPGSSLFSQSAPSNTLV